MEASGLDSTLTRLDRRVAGSFGVPGMIRPIPSDRRVVVVALASRLLVVVAAVVAALFLPRTAGWDGFDPSHATLAFGSVGNVLAAGEVRWDSLWYLHIAAHGYDTASATAFFPGLPLLIALLTPFCGSAALAGCVICWVSFICALLTLHRLTALELGDRAADFTVALVALAPTTVFFNAVYTESLFLTLALGCVYAARQNRWWVAGSLGALAAATRVSGVLLLAFVVLPSAARAHDARHPELGALARRRIPMALVPAGLAVYLLVLVTRGFSPLAPFTAQGSGAHQHRFTGPLSAIAQALQAGAGGLSALLHGTPVLEPTSVASPFSAAAANVWLLTVLGLAVAGLVLVARRLPRAYGLYALSGLAVAIASPIPGEPLKSLDRYVLTIFPLWMAAGAWLSERRRGRLALGVSAAIAVFFAVEFARWTFVA